MFLPGVARQGGEHLKNKQECYYLRVEGITGGLGQESSCQWAVGSRQPLVEALAFHSKYRDL